MDFRDWLDIDEQLQGPKKGPRSPSPTGARSVSMKPARPANLSAMPSVGRTFSGFNAFGMTDYSKKKSGVINPNGK